MKCQAARCIVVSILSLALDAIAAPCVPTEAPQGAIKIDADWLKARGNAPWILDQKGAYYSLATDVITPSTAFVVGHENIVLDLNCRRVVYGNGSSPVVPNGGFEDGSELPSRWTWSGAGKIKLKSAPIGMWGKFALEVSELSSGQAGSLLSEPISISEFPREHSAAITPKGPSAAQVKIKLLDAGTGRVVAEAKSAAVNRGFAAVVRFVATNRMQVRLQVEVTGPGPVWLDRATLERSRDFGIVATPSTWNLPEPLKSDPRIVAAGRSVKSVKIIKGRVQQGWGGARGGSAVNAAWLKGIQLDNLSFFTNGEDTHVVDAQEVAGFAGKDLLVQATSERISNRMTLFAGINLSRARGDLLIEKSSFTGLPQCGIVVARQSASDIPSGEAQRLRLLSNQFNLNAIASDPYAIVLVGINNFVVANNIAKSANGRGLLLDGWGDLAIQDGEIRDNQFDAYERPNLEYDARGIDATALRVRNWKVNGEKPDKSAVRRVKFLRNKFIARTDAVGAGGAIGARISFRNDDGRMNGSGNIFQGNLFRATSTDAKKFAYGLSFSGVYPQVDARYLSDTVESNHIGIQFGDNDSYREREQDIELTDATIRKIAPAAGHSYANYARLGVNQVSEIRFDRVKDGDGRAVPSPPW